MSESPHRVVWGRTTSSNVMKVLWGLVELDLPFERIDAVGERRRGEERGGQRERAEEAAAMRHGA